VKALLALLALLTAVSSVSAVDKLDIVMAGSSTSYGTSEGAAASCARPIYGRAKTIELIKEPGNCVTVRYVSLGKRSCSPSTGPDANDDTMKQLMELCRNTTLPEK